MNLKTNKTNTHTKIVLVCCFIGLLIPKLVLVIKPITCSNGLSIFFSNIRIQCQKTHVICQKWKQSNFCLSSKRSHSLFWSTWQHEPLYISSLHRSKTHLHLNSAYHSVPLYCTLINIVKSRGETQISWNKLWLIAVCVQPICPFAEIGYLSSSHPRWSDPEWLGRLSRRHAGGQEETV